MSSKFIQDLKSGLLQELVSENTKLDYAQNASFHAKAALKYSGSPTIAALHKQLSEEYAKLAGEII